MKLLHVGAKFAAAGVLLVSLSPRVLTAGEIQIAKVNPEGRTKTRIMRIQSAGRTVPVAVAATPALTTADVRDVNAVTERRKVTSGVRPETRDVAAIQIRFTGEGTKKMAAMVQEWKGRQIALIIDGKLVATPILSSAAENGELTFSGNFTPDESRLLAASVKGGSLPPIAAPPEQKKK